MLLIKISKWGNGQGIRIPKNVLELLKWKKDDELEMIIEKGNLKIQKIEKNAYFTVLFVKNKDKGQFIGKKGKNIKKIKKVVGNVVVKAL